MTLGLQQREKLYNLLDQLFDDQLDAVDQRQLSLLIESNDEALDIYLSEMNRHAALAWDWSVGLEGDSVEDSVEEGASGQPLVASEANPKSQINKSQIANLPLPVSIVLDDSTLLSPLSPLPFYISHPFVFSNLFALLVIGIGALGAWFYQIDIPKPMARVDRPATSSGNPSSVERLTFIGQITGMVDVHWADESTAALGGARVPLGRKYALASGLMEITYDTGAKVILQGPATYEVDSPAGGFLSIGKLTARLEKKGEGREERKEKPSAVSGQGSEKVASGQPLVVSGQWPVASNEGTGSRGQGSEAANQKSEIINHKSFAPMFAVRTPSAVVTDLGTEFGVEVSKNGDSECHVFQGVVEATIVRQGKVIGVPSRLIEGQVAHMAAEDVSASPRVELFVKDHRANPKKFVRTLQSPTRSSGWVHCKWETGPSGTFKIANGDLINVGQKTFSAIELTSGEAGWQSSITMLNDGDIYHGAETQVSDYTFNPKDKAVVTIALNTTLHPCGYDIKSIVILTGSAGGGQNRSSQKFDLAYSTVGKPDRYITLHGDNAATVNWNTDAQEAKATLTDARNGLIAAGAAKLRFTIYPTTSKDPESMYREIDVFGSPSETPDQDAPVVDKNNSILPSTTSFPIGGGDKANTDR